MLREVRQATFHIEPHCFWPTSSSSMAVMRRAVLVKWWTSSGWRWTAQDGAFSVGEPLLEDLVASELVGPDGGWDVSPVGAVD